MKILPKIRFGTVIYKTLILKEKIFSNLNMWISIYILIYTHIYLSKQGASFAGPWKCIKIHQVSLLIGYWNLQSPLWFSYYFWMSLIENNNSKKKNTKQLPLQGVLIDMPNRYDLNWYAQYSWKNIGSVLQWQVQTNIFFAIKWDWIFNVSNIIRISLANKMLSRIPLQ